MISWSDATESSIGKAVASRGRLAVGIIARGDRVDDGVAVHPLAAFWPRLGSVNALAIRCGGNRRFDVVRDAQEAAVFIERVVSRARPRWR
jgi:hypothetical protein